MVTAICEEHRRVEELARLCSASRLSQVTVRYSDGVAITMQFGFGHAPTGEQAIEPDAEPTDPRRAHLRDLLGREPTEEELKVLPWP